MKYTYAYKTSDGTRHEAAMEAESRDEVFAALRRRGIRAIKVVAADGSRANGEVRGIRGRTLVATVTMAVIFAGIGVWFFAPTGGTVIVTDMGAANARIARPLPRQMIAGNRKRVESTPTNLFSSTAESFLARFAEPGRMFHAPESEWPDEASFAAALKTPVYVADTEFTERIDLKRIVVGMKQEMSDYLAAGGNSTGYIRELIRRQQTEVAMREKANQNLANILKSSDSRDEAYNYWLKANAQLQSTGIYPLPLPDELREYQLSQASSGLDY